MHYWVIGIAMVLWGLWGCQSNAPEPAPAVRPPVIDPITVPEDFFEGGNPSSKVFLPLLDTAFDGQSDQLAQALRDQYNLPAAAALLRVERHRLYGLPDSVIWIEMGTNAPGDSTCPYPISRHQLLFDHQAQLIHQSTAVFAEFLPYALDSLPLYIEAGTACQAEGQHQVLRYHNGALIDLLNPLLNNTPLTYDIHPDSSLMEQGRLQPRLEDLNQDGYLDLVLEGKKALLYSPAGNRYSPQRPYRRIPLRYHFLYDPAKEYFVYQEQ